MASIPDSGAETGRFAERIRDIQLGNCRLLILKTGVEDVVSWKGSFITNPVFERGEELVQHLMVSLLDKGTQQRDRFQIADLLEHRGARVSFRSRVLRVGFSGKALAADVPDVIDVTAEELQAPLFDPEEFEKARIRLAASIQRTIDESSTQAWLALSRRIYGPAHPNYPLTPEEELERLERTTLDEVRAYFDAHVGAREAVLVVVGDVREDELIEAVERNFAGWRDHDAPAAYDTAAEPRSPQRIPVPMPDKVNIDVRMGHPLAVRRSDEAYIPLHVANFIVGGNFSSRLMDIVRDEKGLTYGVRSSLAGVDRWYDGHWQINITLSQDRLDEGVEATLDVLRDYVRDGATARELEEKKTTLKGLFEVQLATTGGLADTLLRGIENGFGVDYLDDFPRRIDAVTLDALNDHIRRYFEPDALHISMAGTLPEEVNPPA